MFLMVTSSILSQSIKKDSVTISKPVFISIVKESRKCDSIKVALNKKDILISEMAFNNLEMWEDFKSEREKKNEAIEARSAAQEAMNKINDKRFGLSIGIGAGLDSEIKVKPVVALIVSYTFWRF